ncbi:SPOR domain-containing protein [Aliikangiella sp. IMCC44653]
MPKDYAKKKTPAKKKRGASRGNKKPAVPVSLWLFTLLLISALIAGLVYLKWYNPAKTLEPQNQTQVGAKKTKPVPTSEQKPKASSKTADEIPFYEVHQELSNKEVKIPQQDLQLPQNYKKYYYTMPCGSFREQSRAEELKARIGFAGSSSEIIQTQQGSTQWHRVQLGPFNSKRAAEKIRHRMQDNGIIDCRILTHLKKD